MVPFCVDELASRFSRKGRYFPAAAIAGESEEVDGAAECPTSESLLPDSWIGRLF